jgi:UDP-N-acetylmuramate--alanine ligase
VLAAARAFNRRIVLVFQPHRYTRTARLLDAFGPSLAGADHVVLTGIYAAGEDPIPGITVEDLADRIRAHVPVDLVPRLDDVVPAVLRVVRRGDLVITLGAGSIASVPEALIAAIKDGARA